MPIRWRPGRRWWRMQKSVTRYQTARGKGGFRRAKWDQCLELIVASILYTAKKYGPDRVMGFSPIPAMSMLSYAAGSRFLQLFGGVHAQLLRLVCRFATRFPEIWGEKTDVCESADWYNSKYIVSMGSNLNMTRTPDVHFVVEARHQGRQVGGPVAGFQPSLQVLRLVDSDPRGQDGALWMAVNHVILKEFHVDRQVPYFVDYLKRYTDTPFLIEIEKTAEGLCAGAVAARQSPGALSRRGKRRLEDAGTRRQKRPAAHAARRHRLSLAERKKASGTSS